MATTKEIKKRIGSVKDTQKITNAMYLVASAKMRKAKEDLTQTRPYFDALQGEIRRIFKTAKDVESQFFYPPDITAEPEGSCACLVISADKGLAGAYNQNVIKKAQTLLKEHRETKFFVVGEYGRQFFRQQEIPIERSFLYTAQHPTMQRAREISDILLEIFERGEVDKILVIYTDLHKGQGPEAISTRLLPFNRKQFVTGNVEEQKKVSKPFEFSPSIETVLDNVMRGYVAGYIYAALVASFCSEQDARMTAMNSANKNAEAMLEDLSLQYNRVRQAAITQEITEVSSGAKAQRKKRNSEVSK